MIRKNSILLYLFFGAVFSQCSSSNPVGKDLVNYINVELPKVAQLESDAIMAFESVAGSNYTDDSVMYFKIKNVVLPKYTEFYSKLRSIVPATDELKKIHGEYVEAAKDQLEGFNLIADALIKKNTDEIQKAIVNLTKGKVLIESWKSDLLETCKKHNIVIGDKR
jgi:hypothetical protein